MTETSSYENPEVDFAKRDRSPEGMKRVEFEPGRSGFEGVVGVWTGYVYP